MIIPAVSDSESAAGFIRESNDGGNTWIELYNAADELSSLLAGTVEVTGIRKNLFTAAILLISAIILFYFAVQNKNSMTFYDDIVSIHLRDPITGKQAEKIQHENTASPMPYSFTLWGEKQNTRLRNAELLRETETDCILVCGRTDLLFLSCCVLEQNDTPGCLIDADTDDLKQYLQYVPASGKGNGIGSFNRYHSCSVSCCAGYIGSFLLLQINTYKKECITPPDRSLFSEPKLQLFFKRYPAEYWIWYLLQICLFLLFLFLIYHNLSFTDDYIPTKWSDFNFWSSLIREKKEGLSLLFRMPKRKPESLYFLSFYKANIFNLASFFLLIMVIWEQKLITLKKLLIENY